MAIVSAEQVADWIVAMHHRHGDAITNLRLQKLIYYVQAWYLVREKTALFEQDFEAWMHGPVIPELYHKYKKYGSNPIVWEGEIDESEGVPELPDLDEGVADHIIEVLNSYGNDSTWSLEQRTHKERPWLAARGGLPRDAVCTNVITKKSIEEYFSNL